MKLHVDTSSTEVTQTWNGLTTSGRRVIENGDPFQCTILLDRHRALRQITLQNAQIPIGFYNIRPPYNSFTLNGTLYSIQPGNYFTLDQLNSANLTTGNALSTLGSFNTPGSNGITSFNSNVIYVSLNTFFTDFGGVTSTYAPPGQYTSIQTLLNIIVGFASGGTATYNSVTNQITWVLNSLYPFVNFSTNLASLLGITGTPVIDYILFNLNIGPPINCIQVNAPSTFMTTVSPSLFTGTFSNIAQNSFLSFMGYVPGTTVSGNPIPATYPYILDFDTYITMWIENLGQSSQEPSKISFKIPLSNIIDK